MFVTCCSPKVQPVAHLIPNDPANADPARLGEGLQTRRDIHPIAEDVVFLNDHVAQIYPDAEPDAPLLGHLGLALDHPALDLGRATDGINDTRKFCQEAVAGVLHGTAAVLRDFGIDQFPEMRLEPLVRPLLVRSHQARIPRCVGDEDSG
jgi:hypothetical protein